MIFTLIVLLLILFLSITVSVSLSDGNLKAELIILFFKFDLSRKSRHRRKKPAKLTARIILKTLIRHRGDSVKARLFIRYTAGASDPYDAVMRYNAVNALTASLLTLLHTAVKLTEEKINTDIDINADGSTLAFSFGITLRVWKLLHLCLFLLLELLNTEASHGKQTERYDGIRNERNKKTC